MSTLGNFIYAKTKDLFEEQLNAGNILDEAVVFIENTKLIWNHGTYFDCSVASEVFEEYKNNAKQSIDGKVDKVSGKLLSTEDFTTELKTKLNGVNTYKHYYTALSSMDFNQEAWFSVANIQDTESSIIQISTNGHTDVQLAVTTGWESPDDIQKQGGSLTVLNSFMGGANGYFAYVKGVRLRKEDKYAKIEVLVNKPSSNDANKVSIVVSILTNAGHNPLVINNTQTTALQYVGTVDENTIVQSFNLEDKAIISKNLVAENIKLNGYSLEDVSRQMHCVQSDPNLDFDATDNNGNCYGYVGTLQNMNITEKSVIIDSISTYVREGSASPNLDTEVWCRLLRYTNNAWEIIYLSTKSKTIRGVLPETLFTFNMKKVSDNYVIKNTDRIAVTYVDSETADVLTGVQLGFKTINDKPGGLLSALSNTSNGLSWSPALVFNYLPLSKAAVSGDYNDLENKPSTASTTTDGLMSASDKQKIDAELDIHKISEPTGFDFNVYTEQGVYNFHCMSDAINSPVNSSREIKGRLTVLSVSSGNNVVTQVVNLNNEEGGEGNIYIRSCLNGTWKPWSKLQTNVEVGLVTLAALDNDPFLDNGIFSGVCGDTGETFVLICINNYAVAPYNKSIALLKYSLYIGSQDGLTPGLVKIEKRSRNMTGYWTDWENIGGGSTLPEATVDTIGGIRLGTNTNSKFIPLVNITEDGTGVGIRLDSKYFLNKSSELTFNHNRTMKYALDGIGVALGTTPPTINGSSGLIIPCVIGSGQSSDNTNWNTPSVGILYNTEQFCLKYNGLNLKDGIDSGVTKVTWDANSNMNDFKTEGVYDIYGERTVKTDNLPITNDGSGHSIAARLTVVASTLQPANNEICVTQFLQLSNRIGGEGAAYVRTYNENNNGMNDWSAWSKLQTNTEVGLIDSSQLKDFRDNGIYSGVVCGSGSYSSMLYDGAYFKKASTEQSEMIKQIGLSMGMSAWEMAYCYVYYAGNTKYQGCAVGANEDIAASDYVAIHIIVYPNGIPERFEEGAFCSVVHNNSNDVDLNNETFVLVNINNYAVAGAYSKVRSISQFKYGVDLDGNINFKKRLGTGNDAISWNDWEDIGGVGSQEVDITDAVMAYGLPELFRLDSIKENVIYKIKVIANEIRSNSIFKLDNGGILSKYIKDIINLPAFDDTSSLVSIEFDYKIVKEGESGNLEYVINGTVTMCNTSFKFCIHGIGYLEVVDIFKSDVINTHVYTNNTETIKLFPDIVHMVSMNANAVINGSYLSKEAYLDGTYRLYKIFVQKGGNLALGTDVTSYNVYWENGTVPDYTNNSVLVTFENFGNGPYYYAHFKNF